MKNTGRLIKENIGFIITFMFILTIAFIPEAKGLVMRGLIRIGLFEPDISHLKPKPASGPEEPATLMMAPDVEFTSAGGQTISLGRLRGKVVFLNFWATWCGPCIAEMPSVNALYNQLKHRDDVAFILVDADSNLKKAAAFMQRKNFALPVYTAESGVPEQLFRGNLPTTIVIDKSGRVIMQHEGMADYNSPKFVQFMNELAAER